MKKQSLYRKTKQRIKNYPSAAIRFAACVAFLVFAFNFTDAQNIRNNGTINNSGTTSINGYFENFKNTQGGVFNNTGGSYSIGSYFSNNNTGGTDGQMTISGGTVSVTGNYTNDNGSTTINGTGTLQLSGATNTNVTATFSHTAGTVNYAGAAQSIFAATYYNLTFSGSGNKTLDGAITVNNNLQISGSASLLDAGYQITGNASGTLTMNAGTTLTLGTASTATSFPTNYTTITLNSSSTVIYNSNLAQTISAAPTYGNLTLSATASVTKTISGAVTAATNVTVGTNNILSITGAGTLQINTGNLILNGSLNNSGTINIGL